jgi:hypothetical protein
MHFDPSSGGVSVVKVNGPESRYVGPLSSFRPAPCLARIDKAEIGKSFPGPQRGRL